MVSIVILMVGLLGLLQVINVATEQNLKNAIRSEAVQIAENKINELQLAPYDNISASYPLQSIPSKIRGITNRIYNVTKSSSEYHSGSTNVSKELTVHVSWSYKNISTAHEVRTIKTK